MDFLPRSESYYNSLADAGHKRQLDLKHFHHKVLHGGSTSRF